MVGDVLHEECGIFGIFSRQKEETARTVYYALYALQHRGQESCGIAINDRAEKQNSGYKDLGLVGDVFTDKILASLRGDTAVGHCRYSGPGKNNRENAQPLTLNYLKGTLSIALNGNISNSAELREQLARTGAIFQTSNDTEVIAYLVARERLNTTSIEQAVENVIPALKGSFSMLVMSPQKLIAVRDPLGFRPLCMGRLGGDVIFASESCAIDAVGATFECDVRPGEIMVAREDGVLSRTTHCRADSSFCIFEHIYFARPDSFIDGQSVYAARIHAGRILAEEYPIDADIVIGVPDSGIVAAIGYSDKSGIQYREGIIKNRYIGRTFIQPTQSEREESVSIKLNALGTSLKDKRVVMIDDSIVRGTTIRQLVSMVKAAGALEVHVRISSPEFLWPCHYGTDIPSREHLASVKNTPDELRRHIGADSLAFLPLERLTEIAPRSSVGFCDACFSGRYPV